MLSTEQLDGVRAVVRDRRWHEVRLEDIAAAAGVSRMTLHRQGVGKDAVLDGLAALLEAEHQRAVLPALTAPGDAATRLRLALEACCEVDERYLSLLDELGDRRRDAIFHEPGEGPVLTRATFTGALRRLLEDGARDGTLDPGDDPDQTATLLFNAAGWTYRHMRVGHRWAPDQAREAVVALLVRGVRP
jgi:AcrR family transcriptional regulator